MTASDRVGLTGRVKAGNGRGDGNVSVMWKKNAGKVHIEVTILSSLNFSVPNAKESCGNNS